METQILLNLVAQMVVLRSMQLDLDKMRLNSISGEITDYVDYGKKVRAAEHNFDQMLEDIYLNNEQTGFDQLVAQINGVDGAPIVIGNYLRVPTIIKPNTFRLEKFQILIESQQIAMAVYCMLNTFNLPFNPGIKTALLGKKPLGNVSLYFDDYFQYWDLGFVNKSDIVPIDRFFSELKNLSHG